MRTQILANTMLKNETPITSNPDSDFIPVFGRCCPFALALLVTVTPTGFAV
nr:hypothetical protein [uncultured Enterococcus sp.]